MFVIIKTRLKSKKISNFWIIDIVISTYQIFSKSLNQSDVLPTNPRASKHPSMPVIIRLQPSSEKDPDLFFEFSHSPRIYTSAEKVAEEIESLQFSRAQARIELKVYMRKSKAYF